MAFRKPSEIAAGQTGSDVAGYPSYLQFGKGGGDDDHAFWFHDALHHPRPMRPFETIVPEAIKLGLSQANNRLFSFPMSYGIDQRIVNGYIYFGPVGPDPEDTALISARSVHFRERAALYLDNWSEIYQNWLNKVEIQTERLSVLSIPRLDTRDDLSIIASHSGVGSGYKLCAAFNDICDALFLVWQYHFEMLSLGYAAYLNFHGLVRAAFPSISDADIIEMLAGSSTVLYRPKEELQRLALRAIDLGIDEEIFNISETVDADVLAGISRKDWVDDWHATAEEWFNYSNGTGFYFDDGIWNEDWAIPWALLRNYITAARAGSLNVRKIDDIKAARDRTAARYRALITSDADRVAFDQAYAMALAVAPYLEDHNYYVEHRFHAIFWSRMRQLGQALCEHRIIDEQDDIFLFNRWEIAQHLYDVAASWANGTLSERLSLSDEIARRRERQAAFRSWRPPSALGAMPDNLADPLVAVLWGIDAAKVAQWAQANQPGTEGGQLRGLPACPGLARGRVRIIRDNGALNTLERGDILVCRTLAPSWAVAFSTVTAVLSETGGALSHAAIVCREFGIPSIVNLSNAMEIPDRALVEVDATAGVVRILG